MKSIKINLIIYYAILLQIITAGFVFFAHDPIRVARLGIFYQLFPSPQFGALVMLLGVLLSMVGVFIISPSNRFRFIFFLIQHAFMLLTAASAINYIMQGHYADGVVRPWQFIFIDQLGCIAAAILYTFAFLDFEKKDKNESKIRQIIN